MALGDYLSAFGGVAQAAVQKLGTAVPATATYVAEAGQTPTQKYLDGLNVRAGQLDSTVQGLASQNQAAFNDLVGSWNGFYQGQWQPFYSSQASQMPDAQALSMGQGMEGQIQQWEQRVAYAQQAPQQDVQAESYISQLQAQVDADDLAVRQLPASIPGQNFAQFKSDWNGFMQGQWYAFANTRSSLDPATKVTQAAQLGAQIAAWTNRIYQAQALVAQAARQPPPPRPAPPPPRPAVYTPPGVVPGTSKGAQVPAYTPPAPARPPVKKAGIGVGGALAVIALLSASVIVAKRAK